VKLMPGGDLSFEGPAESLDGYGLRLGTPLMGGRVGDVLSCIRVPARPWTTSSAPGSAVVGDNLVPANARPHSPAPLPIDPGLEPIHIADSMAPVAALLALALDRTIASGSAIGTLASFADSGVASLFLSSNRLLRARHPASLRPVRCRRHHRASNANAGRLGQRSEPGLRWHQAHGAGAGGLSGTRCRLTP